MREELREPTLIAYFERVDDARQCAHRLRLAGFAAADVGAALPRRRSSLAGIADALAQAGLRSVRGSVSEPGSAIVTVRPGPRSEEARQILQRSGGDEAAVRPGSPVRAAVIRAAQAGSTGLAAHP